MTDRERLIEILEDTLHEWECDVRPETLSQIAEHLLENGVIIPPCKVGETLYLVQIDYEGNYFMTSVIVGSKITILSILRAYEEKTIVYMSTAKEEAEKALAERSLSNA